MPHIVELHDSLELPNMSIPPSYVWKINNPNTKKAENSRELLSQPPLLAVYSHYIRYHWLHQTNPCQIFNLKQLKAARS